MARIIAVALCIIILVGLFVFPRQRLNKVCDAINELAEETVEAVLAKDWEKGAKNLNKIHELYEADKVFLHMLLSHSCIEVLETSINGAIQLMKVQDQPQALLELEVIITHVAYLKTIEELKLLTLM